MLKKELIGWIYFVAVFGLIAGCSIRKEDDVYEIIPKGSLLEKKILCSSAQIVKYHDELILVYDISSDLFYNNSHLLFFDSSMVLYAATYFSGGKIESIVNDTIYFHLNGERNSRIGGYRNDLPNKYKLIPLSTMDTMGRGWENHICIDRIILDSFESEITLIVRKSANLYIGGDWSPSKAFDSFFDGYSLQDTLHYAISELLFDYSAQIIATTFKDERGYLISNQMIVPQKKAYDTFFDQFWNRLKR